MPRSVLLLLLPLVLASPAFLPARKPPSGVSDFKLNTVNTTSYGPAWTDTILSLEADWVMCRGNYAFCFYAKCSKAADAAWAPEVPMADCECDKHDGLYLVDINAILDEQLWRATRERCPLGMVSCPLPNTAAVCSRINDKSMFQGAEGVQPSSLVSAYFFDNATDYGLGFTDCSAQPGPYAGCMTAPCSEDKNGKVICQCPIATGPFQVGGIGQRCDGVPSASYQPSAAKATDDVWSLVPDHCDAEEPICYEGTLQAVSSVLQADTINCPGKNQSVVTHSTCLKAGYGLHLGKDPIFRETDIYAVRPKVAPTDFIERCEQRSKTYQAPAGTKALVITTSHGVLGDANCSSCTPTGVASPEFTAPYYIFKDAGVNVTLASIKGGAIPIDTEAQYMTHWDTRFWSTPSDYELTIDTPSVDELTFTDYDLVYMAGGWGAAWDMGTSDAIAKGITAAAAAGKVLGSVCHGGLGFIQATTPEGGVFVQGRNMSAVTNRQIEQLGIASTTPLHPETELRKRGANFFASHGVLTDLDQSMVVVDGQLVTGQNQNSACETAQRMMDQIV